MSEYVDFHYMPLEGKITGKQVLKQTEDAINDLGNKVYSLDIDQSEIDEAIEKSNEAINTANSALTAVTTGRSVWFNNVAEMVATDIEAGVTAETKGYYVANDGGNALYLIRQEKSGDVVDGGSLIALDNGNMAELVTDGTVNVKQFGAIGNGTDDDTTVFQNTSSYAQTNGFVPFVGVATYKITSNITGTFNSFGEVTITGGGSVNIINLQEVVSDVSDIRDEVVDETASAKGYSESAATSATNASNSASSASTTATQLMDYLATKETLTAPAVDPTLTISGAAADAQVTGNQLTKVNNQIKGSYKRAYDVSMWELGAISSSTGGTSASTTRMRTNYLEYGIDVIEPVTGYKYLIAAYDSDNNDTYVGMWDGSIFKKSATWLTSAVSLYSLGFRNYKYRLVAATTTDSALTISTDAQKIIFYYNTDTTLTQSGVPADASVVGDSTAPAPTELRGIDGWTYMAGMIDDSTGNVIPANSYSTYVYAATKNLELWSDNDIYSVGNDFILAIYTSDTISSSTYTGKHGRQRKDSGGNITSDDIPKFGNKMSVTAGQYIGVSVKKECTFFRLFANKDSGLKRYLASNVVLSGTQVQQVKDALSAGIVNKDAYTVHMYIPTSNGQFLIEYDFILVDDPSINAYGWRLCYIWLCDLNHNHINYIAYTGEWEMAIRIDGRDDFIGLGNHGDEQQTLFKLFVDGEEITENGTFADRKFEEVQLLCKLTMYDPADGTTVVGYHTRIDTVNAAKKTITIENHVEFSANLTLRAGYMFMCPIARKAYDDVQITDKFIDNSDYILTDCSTTTFAPDNANHGVGEAKSDTTEYKFWGGGYNLWGYAKILRRIAPEGNTQRNYIDDAASYNKIYLSMCTNGETVADGDKWIMETEFFLDSGFSGNV